MITFIATFALCLTLPGALIYRFVFRGWPDLLLAFSLSLALLILCISAILWLNLPLTWFTPVVAALIGIPGALLLLSGQIGGRLRLPKRFSPYYLGMIAVSLGTCAYLFFAGVYTEVPADFWRYLTRIQDAYQVFSGQSTSSPHDSWYYVPAWFRYVSGDDALGFVLNYGVASTLVHCLGIYVFSHSVARRHVQDDSVAVWIAVGTVLISAFSVGVNIFSYIRYYTFAPTFHNLLVCLCCVRLVLSWLSKGKPEPREIFLIFVLVVGMLLVQKQEVAFLFGFVLSLSLVILSDRLIPDRVRSRIWGVKDQVNASKGLWFASLTWIVFLAAFLYSRYNFPVEGQLSPWVVPVATYLPFGEHIYIADPKFQIYRSITLWGLWVYLLFFLNWQLFKHNLYIVAAMTIPLVTVLNPAFVDLFFRHSSAGPIYRLMYMLPLGLVAATYIITSILSFTRMQASRNAMTIGSWVVLVGLLQPLELGSLRHYTRMHTLGPVLEENDYPIWSDVLAFLATQEQTRVTTDAVTAYMIRATTHHRAAGYKFFHETSEIQEDHDIAYYRKGTGNLIVINRRNGGISVNGELSGHWYKDALIIGDQYPQHFVEMIHNNPQLFRRIWAQDGVEIFRTMEDQAEG